MYGQTCVSSNPTKSRPSIESNTRTCSTFAQSIKSRQIDELIVLSRRGGPMCPPSFVPADPCIRPLLVGAQACRNNLVFQKDLWCGMLRPVLCQNSFLGFKDYKFPEIVVTDNLRICTSPSEMAQYLPMISNTSSTNSGVRLAELMAALSIATDLGLGQPAEFSLSACILAVRLAEKCVFSEAAIREVYYQALLRFIGCNAETDWLSSIVGDEQLLRSDFHQIDNGDINLIIQMFTEAIRKSYCGRISRRY